MFSAGQVFLLKADKTATDLERASIIAAGCFTGD
jgi:hypothetical protein